MRAPLMKLGHINIRSLFPKVAELKDKLIDCGFDVLAMCETWLHCGINNSDIKVDGYSLVRRDRVGRGGGVGIYIRNEIKFNVIHTGHEIEQLWVMLHCDNLRFVFGVVYRPPHIDYKMFLNSLGDTLVECMALADVVYFCGDVNIDLLNIDSSSTAYLCDFIESLNFVQLIEQPTRAAGTSISLIDHIYVADSERVRDCGVIDCSFSDHDFIYFEIYSSTPAASPRLHTYRDYKHINYEQFCLDLHMLPLHFMFRIDNINDKVEFLNRCLLGLFDRHAPRITRRFSKPYAPWITDNLRLLMNLRDKARAKYRRTKSAAHWDYYKSLRNLTSSTYNREKKAYFDFISRTCSFQQLFKRLEFLKLGKPKHAEIPANLKDVDAINSYFSSVSANFAPPDHTGTYSNSIDTFKFNTVDTHLVNGIVNKIGTAATGIDGISITMIRMCCPVIIPFITHIINSCIMGNCFPVQWKHALITPLPKVKEPTELQHLRPISILPILSKILEKILHSQITQFVQAERILPDIQSGFRPGYGCETALLKITDDVLEATDRGDLTLLTLLDFSKAFDTVNHDLMVLVLGGLGFSSSSVQLIGNFLRNRRQSVQLNGVLSKSLPITQGVAQGSILGPLLFSLYTSDMVNSVRFCKIHMFADDTQLYRSFSAHELRTAVDNMNSDLKLIHKFATQRNLVINASKSQVALFGKDAICKKLKDSIQILLNDQPLSVSDKVKNLGLILDNTFRYKHQITKYISRAYLQLKKLYPYRHTLNIDVKTKLCEVFVLSHFTYCSTVYHSALDRDTEYRIQKVQNSCLRFIYGIRKFEHISFKLVETGWLDMWCRRELRCLRLYHKVLNTKTPPYLYNKIRFRSDVHSITTRFRGLLSPPRHKTALFQRSFAFSMYSKYNRVPEALKPLSDTAFRNKMRSLLMGMQSDRLQRL